MKSKAEISVRFVLCSINSNFESPNPNPILIPERASTALHGAVAALNGGRWRRSSPFGISYYALLHGRHRAEYKRRRAEGGGGRERQRERGTEAGKQRQTGDRSVLFSLSGDRGGRSSLLSPTVFGPLRRTGPRVSGGLGARPILLTDKLSTTRGQLLVNILVRDP